MDNAQLLAALQTVSAPVVLISGVGMLVLSMTNRFSHATDRVRHLAEERHKLDGVARQRAEAQIRILYRRLRVLLIAIALALGSVLLTALLIVTLFANYLYDVNVRELIIVLFGLCLLSLVSSLVLFIRDMSMSLSALQEDLRDVL
jgi:hypothetical protein